MRNGVLQRKCACGNQTVSGGECETCSRESLQRKLSIGTSNDPLEVEADRVADQVLAVSASPAVSTAVLRIQRFTSQLSGQEDTAPASVDRALGDSGRRLDPLLQENMEQRFGYDFSRVRVHSGVAAAQSARDVNAHAYTVGHDVVFGTGRFAPGTREGRHLLAHELVHVVQQTGSDGIGVGRGNEKRGLSPVGSGGLNSIAGRRGGLLLRRPKGEKSFVSEKDKLPTWTARQLGTIQAELKRLGFYSHDVDRRFGPDTESGLVETFGGDEWRSLDPKEIIKRLKEVKRPAGKKGEHALRYGEMFKDGLLDMTLGVGFDESGWGERVAEAVQKSFKAKGFHENRAQAKEIYERTGHHMGASAFGLYFVWDKSLTYKPPAGAKREIKVVVRLVTNADEKHGADAAGAFKEGMKESDVAFYAGHGRLGSGPDFDRAMRIELLDPKGKVEPGGVYNDYEAFEEALKIETRSKDQQVLWQRFLWRLKHNRIRVTGTNEGNVFVNPANPHAGEFLANLMYWNLTRRSGTGAAPAAPVTGKGGELARSQSENNYRVWVFNGCRTQDYQQSIRRTPGLDTKSTDLLLTQRTIYWSNYADSITAFLDAILKQQSAEQIVKEMDATNIVDRPAGPKGVAVRAEGLADNPVVP